MSAENEEQGAEGAVSARGRREIPAGTILATLLNGVLYADRDQSLWNAMLNLRSRVSDLAGQLGLKLLVFEDDGFAFLKTDEQLQEEGDSSVTVHPPRLMARRQLSFEMSVLLVLLRQRLMEFESEGNGTRLILPLSELTEMMQIYYPADGNRLKTERQIGACIKKAEEMGFLRKLRQSAAGVERYEVMAILKAFMTGDTIAALNEKLEKYSRYAQQKAERGRRGKAGADYEEA
ncbi:MAG: DUF4194 domain-containing protein [Succinivibrio sp.]|jgi:hypothetical protein|nr:DUF4194 domain-containing protein [Succinivibrio sp.]